MTLLVSILYDSLYHTTPILLAVLGGLFAYKAGVLNISLEGMMLTGALTSLLIAQSSKSFLVAFVISILATLLVGLIFAYFGVVREGNVIVIGLGINILIPAISGFILERLNLANLSTNWMNPADFRVDIPIVKNIPYVGNIISGHPFSTYLSLALIIFSSILLYRTKFGIYTRVVGETPKTAKSLGINIKKHQIIAILIGAIFSAIAGFNMSYERLGIFTKGMIAGRGFIAIAAIYCGNGDPVKSSLYALIFGLAKSLSINLSIYAGSIAGLFDIIPYIIMVLILSINSGIQNRNVKVRKYW